MEETIEKIQELKNEILALKETSELYKQEMQHEISSIDQQIHQAKTKITETQTQATSARAEYQKSESQIVSLQFSLESSKKTIKEHHKQRAELETLNDQWEKSIRTLEFYNNGLESQLNQTESNILTIHSKIQDTSFQESVQKIKTECEELKQVLRHKSRSPSPVTRPPVPPRPQMELVKLETTNIVSKPAFQESCKVIIVAPDPLYLNENAVVVKENSLKKVFEFNKVVRRSQFVSELNELLDYTCIGRNTCLVLCSGKHRQDFVLAAMHKFSSKLTGKNADLNCVEIVKDQLVNLFPHEWRAVSLGAESEGFVKEAFKRLSRGKNHLLLTFKFSNCVLQLLDLGEVNEDQSLSESLSINASLFYIEELMMTLSKGKPRFDKTNLTKKLQMSLGGDFFLMFLMNFDELHDLPVLSLAARLQSMFARCKTEHEQVHRTITMLEKERLANFDVLRVIEKAQKDLALLRKAQVEKERVIEDLQKRMKVGRKKMSLSPTSPLPPVSPVYNRPTKIPMPRSAKRAGETFD